MPSIPIQLVAGTDDAMGAQDGTSFDNSSNTMWMGRWNTTAGQANGWRVLIPSTVDPTLITGLTLSIIPNQAAQWYGKIIVERVPATNTWANTTTDRPIARWNAATTTPQAGATSTQVTWNQASNTTINQFYPSPALSIVDVKAACAANPNHSTTGTYIGVIFKGDIGAQNQNQIITRDHVASNLRPFFTLTYNRATVWTGITETNTDYGDGVANSPYQRMDISIPASTPGTRRPLIFLLHGGFWSEGVGTRADIASTGIIAYLNGLGYATANCSYALSNSDAFSNTGHSFPDPIQHINTAMKFMNLNSDYYPVDTSRFFIIGDSAGGHVALWTGVSYGDAATYTGYQNVNTNRGSTAPIPGNTRPNFDLDKNTMTGTVKPAGVACWNAPISVQAVASIPDPQGGINAVGRGRYMGEKLGTNPPFTNRELDLDVYIAGSGSPYTPTKHEPTMPILYIRGTLDTIVPKSTGEDMLVAALGTSGFTYPVPAVGTISPTGLTRQTITENHENSKSSSAGWTHIANWLAVVDPGASSTPAWTPRLLIT